MKAFLKCLVIFVYPFLFKVGTPKHGLEVLCGWWTCSWWASLVRKFYGHWFITRCAQIFYPLCGSVSLGKDFLLSYLHCVSLVSWKFFWSSGGRVYTGSLYRELSLHPLVSIQLIILAHFKPNIFASRARLVPFF